MTSDWRALPLPQNGDARPSLIVKCRFTKSSYVVHLTDLTRIWSESLDRREIIRRALNEDTSIDPSEDSEQLRILLQKIQGAINGDEGTTLHLDERGPGEVRLNVQSPLPEPLKPLRWPIHLSTCSPEVLTNELLLPVLAEHADHPAEREISQRVAPSPANEPESDRLEASPAESAQERADRKREELKRRLEEKSRAPAKKKRRF
ncbi:MAG: hypothetical protein M1832_006450 [Thelocarpon impressellum]|nr:MAG: hypothetical protein M1832_006450 [Thelocarpon impressellum]